MAQTYVPGLLVAEGLPWRCRRQLPVPGRVLVSAGTTVSAEQVIARTELPGDVTPFPLAKPLGVSPGQLSGCLRVSLGAEVAAGEVIAESTAFWGLLRAHAKAPAAGTLESVSAITGQAILRGAPIPVEVRAYLAGTVVEVLPETGCVIAARVAVVQGIFGVGGETYGSLLPVCTSPAEDLTADKLSSAVRGQIVVGGRRVTHEAVRAAQALGAAAIVTGGIDDQDLRAILGYDLGVAVTGTEKLGLSLIITEGFGEIAMADRTFALLNRYRGVRAACNGTTQIRAGVLRPEILIPLAETARTATSATAATGQLTVSATVRVIREPYFGRLGKVVALPPEPQWLESGSKARIVQVALAHGPTVTVPRANVELMEGA